ESYLPRGCGNALIQFVANPRRHGLWPLAADKFAQVFAECAARAVAALGYFIKRLPLTEELERHFSLRVWSAGGDWFPILGRRRRVIAGQVTRAAVLVEDVEEALAHVSQLGVADSRHQAHLRQGR